MRSVIIHDCASPLVGTDTQVRTLLKVRDLGNMSEPFDKELSLSDINFETTDTISEAYLYGEYMFTFNESDTGYELSHGEKNIEISIEEMFSFPKFTSLVICDDCEGKGHVEVMDCKVGSASICCGGCTKFVPCECEGVIYHE